MKRHLLPLAFFLLVPVAGRAAELSPEFTRARALHEKGRHAEALTALATLRANLPAEARLNRWSIDFERRVVGGVLIGQKHLYYTTHGDRGGRSLDLGVPDDRPSLADSKEAYDFRTVVTCVDAVTGKKRWTRRLEGYFHLAVDPRDDRLHCWREKLFVLNPADGNVVKTVDLPREGGRVEAILFAGKPFLPRPQGNFPTDQPGRQVPAFDADAGRVRSLDLLPFTRLAPNEKRMLQFTIHFENGAGVTTIAARPPRGGRSLWEYRYPAVSGSEPFWFQEDVLALNGGCTGPGEVIRLRGSDGSVRWRLDLPRGAYRPGKVQLADNSYPPRNWSAFGFCGKHLLVVGGEGTLSFLDPDTGRVAARATPGVAYLTRPSLVGEALVVATSTRIRAIPLAGLLDPNHQGEKEVALLQAKCLAALGRVKEARGLLGPVLQEVPEFSAGWDFHAELCRRDDQPFEELAARCRHLELAGQDSDPELRRRWGLLRRLATGSDLLTEPEVVGETVYLGTRSGTVLGVDVRSLDVIQRRRLPAALLRLDRAVQLRAYLNDGQKPELARLSEDSRTGPEGAPAEWAKGRSNGPAVRWRGKWYRPLPGGHVRVLDGDKVKEARTKLAGIKTWQIHVSPHGPLGFGDMGVYALDDRLCPVRQLLSNDVRQGGALPGEVFGFASDARTFGLLTWDGERWLVQVWSRDGKAKVREQEVQAPGYLRGSDCLQACRGGYLLSAGEVAWVPADPKAPAWRFGFGASPGRAVPAVEFAHTTFWGKPLLRDDLLFVRCRDGALYVFDLDSITRPAG